MKYRLRILLFLVGTAFFSSAVTIAVAGSIARTQIRKELNAKYRSLAMTAASMIDGDAHEQIGNNSPEGRRGSEQIRSLLRRVRDVNRRQDVNLAYLYTLMRARGDEKVPVFGVNPEEKLRNRTRIGDVYKWEGDPILFDRVVRVENRKDQWGKWLSATAPILNSSGETVALLVANAPMEGVQLKLSQSWLGTIAALGVACSLAIAAGSLLSRQASEPLRVLYDTVKAIEGGNLDAKAALHGGDEFADLARAVNSMGAAIRERETIKASFARYVSQQVMDKIIQSGELPAVSGERRKITVLFADIRDFTSLSEGLEPEEVTRLLNEYFEAMLEVIFRNHGTLDKFIGDGIMAIFGAPLDDPFQEENAIKTALEMREEIAKLSAKWEAEGRGPIRIGIGIHSGNAIVGNIGSAQRLEYTALGDAVNVASRLESATKEHAVDLLVSQHTYDAARGAYRATRIGDISVKGKVDPVPAFTIG